MRAPKFETFVDGAGEHRWRLKSANGQVIATSGEGYCDARGARRGIAAVRKAAAAARIVETTR